MGDDNLLETFSYVATQLGKRKIAFICTREHFQAPALTPAIKKAFGGKVIINEQMSKDQALELIEKGVGDAVAFGRWYIANPDLVERLRTDAQLNPLNQNTIYAEGETGYTDYPAMA
jgi:N-ethylmaleimide reductase